MNIWIVNHYAVPPTFPTGARHYTLARELIRKGHQVTLLSSSFSHQIRAQGVTLPPKKNWKYDMFDDVPFVWLRTPPYQGNTFARFWNMLVFTKRLWLGRWRKSLPKPDVIIGSSPHLFAAFAAHHWASYYRIPFVLEIRDLWPQSLIELGNFSKWHPFMLMLASMERYLYRRANHIITLLPKAKPYILEKGGSEAHISWLPNGVDLTRVPVPEPPKERRAFTVTYAGSHGPANGLDLVLDAARLLCQPNQENRIAFQLVGKGPEKARLQARAKDEGIHNVRFRDQVPKAEAYRVMQDSDALLMVLQESPIFKWGISPNKLFDYLASARPVVFAVNSPFNPVEEAQAGITVAPGDAQSLAEGVRYLATLSNNERWQMGQRARAYVEENHSYTELASALETLLASL